MSTLKFDDLYILTFKDISLNEFGRQNFAHWVATAQNSTVPSQFVRAFQKEWFRHQNEDSTVPPYSLLLDTLHPLWGKIAAKLLKLDLKDKYQARHAVLYAIAISRIKLFLDLKDQVKKHVDEDLLPVLEKRGKEVYEFYRQNPALENGLGIEVDALINLRSNFNSMTSDYLEIQTEVGRLINTVDEAEKDAVLSLRLVWSDLRISTYGDLPGAFGIAFKAIRTIKRMPTKETLYSLHKTVETQFSNKQLVNNVLILGQ